MGLVDPPPLYPFDTTLAEVIISIKCLMHHHISKYKTKLSTSLQRTNGAVEVAELCKTPRPDQVF